MKNIKQIEKPKAIDNSILKELDFVRICMENCETFDIKSKDINSIKLEKMYVNKEFCRYEGELVISKSAFKNISSFCDDMVDDKKEDFNVVDLKSYEFIYRVIQCQDIVAVDFYFLDKSKIECYVEYDPLEKQSKGYIVEDSNTNSSIIDKNGDLLLSFGKFSTKPKRVDNNYFELAPFLKSYIQNSKNKIIKIKIDSITTDINGFSKNIVLDASIVNFNKKEITFIFNRITDLEISIYDDTKGNHELLMSKTMDGRIFIQIGVIFNFFCEEITGEI